jgi:hypothetical protein
MIFVNALKYYPHHITNQPTNLAVHELLPEVTKGDQGVFVHLEHHAMVTLVLDIADLGEDAWEGHFNTA